MNLNLWAVNDWLREYDTKINCTSPKQEFSGIRLYQPGQEIVPYALYIGRSDDFFHDGGRNVVCRGGSDTLT
ncbi:MAG: hypothetical protein LUC17_00140, partial [Oscillospiraceae bacterium]|nr:hypothetical protein [Oscillospiraceae bacterium]